MTSFADVLDALRRPAHTGARRCVPCTLLNLGLLAACTAVLARRNRRPLAVALAAVGTSAVWLRGYVVPYTPRFAPQVVAALPIPEEMFHPGDARDVPDGPGSLADADLGSVPRPLRDERENDQRRDDGERVDGERSDDAMNGDAVLAALVDAGVLVPEGDSLSLAAEAREHWEREIDSLNSLPSAELAAEIEESVPTVTDTRVVDGDSSSERSRWIALGDGSAVATESWLSRPVAIAELATLHALDAFDLAPETRLAAARPLRMFLRRCPDCGGPVEETTTATCCGGVTSPRMGPRDVLACGECDERLFTFQ